jgi:hypothetical protein
MTDELEWVHIPIQDETAPSLDQIQQFVALVDKAKNDSKVSRIKQIKLFSVLELMFHLTLDSSLHGCFVYLHDMVSFYILLMISGHFELNVYQ